MCHLFLWSLQSSGFRSCCLKSFIRVDVAGWSRDNERDMVMVILMDILMDNRDNHSSVDMISNSNHRGVDRAEVAAQSRGGTSLV